MNVILACDTTQAACSVALAYKGGIISRLQSMTKGHAEALMPLLEEVLDEAQIKASPTKRSEIDYLLVTNGPGSFTGVRVGLSAMAGLALAWDKPLVPYGTLAAMMLNRTFSNETDRPMIVAVDARRDTFYTQFFHQTGTALTPPQALSATQLLKTAQHYQSTLDIDKFYIMGTGKAAFAACDFLVASHSVDYPQAEIVVRHALAWQPSVWQAIIESAPAPVAPLYLRPPDATLPDKSKYPRLA
ncbi:MAG: tRNA (adenosine(37)-N6)-threonylcarbamoyltransferase complex dimerization subunit type 1 TsaB [Alphaproteobacteria bacterium]|nr:tRNA (adenosine(37)-N6)-threonylcarbamoyltransferase complex dimerization subunit type 1 TsaB [Alphaproteobacteria bacterium]MBE8220849.1 tRNA (adenosine(37)-N6)-threonylcarbamoyltransferase complex dimerization subunit type 1 TsaB [Alphaproteobacteria bacterium]